MILLVAILRMLPAGVVMTIILWGSRNPDH